MDLDDAIDMLILMIVLALSSVLLVASLRIIQKDVYNVVYKDKTALEAVHSREDYAERSITFAEVYLSLAMTDRLTCSSKIRINNESIIDTNDEFINALDFNVTRLYYTLFQSYGLRTKFKNISYNTTYDYWSYTTH